MKTNSQVPQNRFLRIVTIPVRALVRAKDFYVRSMINCSSGVGYGGMGGMGAVHTAAPLPRSFSSSSSMSNQSEDYIELVRAASGHGNLNKAELDLYLQQQMMMQNNKGVAGSRKMPRSASVAMGKIDEDKPYSFGEDAVEVDIKTQMKYPRSRSYAPTQRKSVFAS